MFTLKDLMALVVSSLFAFFVFGNISRKAGYPRWHGLLMAIPFVNVVMILAFAFSTWPIEGKLLQRELRGSQEVNN